MEKVVVVTFLVRKPMHLQIIVVKAAKVVRAEEVKAKPLAKLSPQLIKPIVIVIIL